MEQIEIVPAEKQAALAKVEELAKKLGQAETLLERGYAQFAQALLTVQKHKYWEDSFVSWGDYLDNVTTKFNLGRAQLYHKLSTVKQLQESVSLEDMTEMGISKATVLANVHSKYGSLPSGSVEMAKELTVKELKQSLAEALHTPEEDHMEWMDLGYAFYVTPEEKAEIVAAEKAAREQDPAISTSLKDFMQKKEIVLRFVREFLATYPAKDEESLF